MNKATEACEDFGYDSDVNALLADLEASIASFDARIEQRRREEMSPPRQQSTVNSYPEVDPEAVFCNVAKMPAAPPETKQPALVQPAPVAGARDLLAELRNAVDSLSESEKRSDASDLAQRQRFSSVLRSTFDYFHELTQHLNALRPELPCSYALGRGAEFVAPEWQKGNAHARTPANDEFRLVESVVVRGTCMAATDLAIACPRHQASTLRHEMALLNIHILDDDERSDATRVRLILSREIRIQLHFSSCFDTGNILIHARNVGGFGLAAYAVTPQQLDREALNMLGEQILGRRLAPPAAFRPIPFSQGLGK